MTRAIALAAALAVAATAGAAPPPPGVYQYVVHRAEGTVESISDAIAAAAPAAGFQAVARVPAAAPEGCGYRASVVVLFSPEFAGRLVAANRRTGPFAAADRVSVFEDERGVHVSILNPRSTLRTILMDDQGQAALIEAHLAALRALVSGAVRGAPAGEDYGEPREKGYIGKTMGVMAGGPFTDKVEDVASLPGGDWRQAAARVKTGLERSGPKWGLRLAYAIELPDAEAVVLGTTGAAMEAKSFSIVGAGADADRSGLKCPGLAHAAAYPIEVVVARDAGAVRVRVVDTMYRMKMFFEDAGKWAFMKNMGMPGSIHDEIAAQVRSAVGGR